MKLISLTVGRYGKHENLHLDFDSSLQCFVYPNGWGKSTLLSFIKVMFYGFSKNRGHDLDENERAHYLPWGADTASGSIVYEAGEKTYRLERTFGKKANDDTAKLFDQNTGRELPLPECLGEELFLIDAEGFERTVFLSERQLRGKNENKSIAARIADLTGVDGDIGNLDEAIAILEKERKLLQKRGGRGGISDIEAEINACKAEIRNMDADLKSLDVLEAELKNKQAQLANRQKEKEEWEAEYRKLPPRNKKAEILLQIEKEKERTEGQRRILKKAQDYLGKPLPNLDEIRNAEDASRTCHEAREKAEQEKARIVACKSSPFDTYPLDENKLGEIANKADLAKRFPLFLLLSLLCVSSTIVSVIFYFRTFFIALLVCSSIFAVLSVLSILRMKRCKDAKAETDAVFSLYFPGPYDGDSYRKLTALFKEFLETQKHNLQSEEEVTRLLSVAEEKEKQAKGFLSRFPSDDADAFPFETIRRHLLEVSTLSAVIEESDKHVTALTAEVQSDIYVLAEKLYDDLDARIFACQADIASLSEDIAVLSTKVNAFDDLENRRESVLSLISEMEAEKERKAKTLAVNLKTQELLKQSAESLTAMYLGPTQKTFHDLMAVVDQDGNYHLNTSFEISKEESAVSHVANEYSRGTRDLYDFVLRLSLCEALYTKEKPFLLLDDPLLALDDKHFKNAAKVLQKSAETFQILYFTCTEKRKI